VDDGVGYEGLEGEFDQLVHRMGAALAEGGGGRLYYVGLNGLFIVDQDLFVCWYDVHVMSYIWVL
jgi:hypothetical protein